LTLTVDRDVAANAAPDTRNSKENGEDSAANAAPDPPSPEPEPVEDPQAAAKRAKAEAARERKSDVQRLNLKNRRGMAERDAFGRDRRE
jgi:hypothetical protein